MKKNIGFGAYLTSNNDANIQDTRPNSYIFIYNSIL
jgi:hypothetical protein